MTRRDDRASDPLTQVRRAEDHRRSRRNRHRRRPCGGNTPSTPTALQFIWTKDEKGRHDRLSVYLRCDEVTTNTAGAAANMDRYIFQLEHSDDGVTADGDPIRFLVAAKDDDANSTVSVYSRKVRKHLWYRFRCKVINRDGCSSAWSSWTSWTLANDSTAPPSPLLVKVFSNATNRIVIDWDPPVVWLPTEGTVDASIGTNTLSGTGTAFNAQVGVGTRIKVDAEERTVTAITSDTSATVDANWGSAHSGAVCYTEEPDPDVAFYQVWIGTTVGFTPPAYKKDTFVHATKKGIKVADADEGSTFYARVRSVDASGNRSAWIPGTIAGNSNPATTPDGILIGKGGGAFLVATFTKPGRLRVKHYPQRWTNVAGETLTFKRARAVVSIHDSGTHPNDGCPQGSAVKIAIHRWLADESAHATIFADDDKLIIGGGTHKDTLPQTSFAITTLAADEQLSVNIKNIGSSFPGEDLVVQVLMEP